jgi:hypothetical protein
VGESETPVFGEFNPPKNSRIPWMSQEIINGGSWAALTVGLVTSLPLKGTVSPNQDHYGVPLPK